MRLSTYEKISFEEATRILYYAYGTKPLFKLLLEELMAHTSEPPYKCVAPIWYEDYAAFLQANRSTT